MPQPFDQARCRRALRIARNLSLWLVTAASAGCYRYAAVPGSVAPGEPGSFETARVSLTDGRRIVLHSVTVTRDSVVGTHLGSRMAVDRAAVTNVEKRTFATGKTLLITFGVLAVISIVAYATTDTYQSGLYQ